MFRQQITVVFWRRPHYLPTEHTGISIIKRKEPKIVTMENFVYCSLNDIHNSQWLASFLHYFKQIWSGKRQVLLKWRRARGWGSGCWWSEGGQGRGKTEIRHC